MGSEDKLGQKLKQKLRIKQIYIHAFTLSSYCLGSAGVGWKCKLSSVCWREVLLWWASHNFLVQLYSSRDHRSKYQKKFSRDTWNITKTQHVMFTINLHFARYRHKSTSLCIFIGCKVLAVYGVIIKTSQEWCNCDNEILNLADTRCSDHHDHKQHSYLPTCVVKNRRRVWALSH